MIRSAPPPLPEKIEEEPTRTPTRRPPEKPPELPAEPEIDALAKKTAPLPIAARPASPAPVRQEPSEQTAVVRPSPIPAPQHQAVSPPREVMPQAREGVRAPVNVEQQRATDAQQSAPPAIEVPADVRAKTPMTMLPVEGPPAEAKLSIKMATAEEGIIAAPAARAVRVASKQKRIEPAYPAARLIKGGGLASPPITPAESVAKSGADAIHHAVAAVDAQSAQTVSSATMANVAPPVSPNELPWWIRALAGPALVRVKDRWLSSAERFAAEHWVGTVAQAVGAVIGQRIAWEWAGGSIDAEGQAFGVLMSTGGAEDEEFMIGVDGALARTIVSRITAQFAQLRGAGDSISDAEAGVLEFVALTAADRLADSAAQASTDRPMGAVFKQFLTGAEAVAWGSRSAVGGLSVQAVVGSQAGLARIWLPRSVAKSVLQQVKRTPPMPAAAEVVLVSLQLPEIVLSEVEWNALTPGDLLLLGVTQLAGPSPRWRLVTSNGWSLCEAECTADTPTLIAAECSSLDVNVDPATVAGAAGKRILRATLGQATLASAHLAHWKTGTRIELPKDARTPIELWHGTERVGRGEIVNHDSEKAVHVLEWGEMLKA